MKSTRPHVIFLFLFLPVFLISCGKGGKSPEQKSGEYPGTEEGLKSVLKDILADGKLSTKLRPTAEDYAAVFEGEFAKKAEATYKEPWEKGQLVLKAKPGQTEIKVFSVTVEDLKAKNEKSNEFPGGWTEIAPNLKPGLTIYMVRVTEPGKDLGMRFDGFVYVNGRWRIFPKPWRIR